MRGPKDVYMRRVSSGFTETDTATRIIERLARADGTDAVAARESLMRSRGGILSSGGLTADRSLPGNASATIQ